MKPTGKIAVVLLATAFIVTSAFAQDFYRNTVSAESAAMGGVYVPSSSGALDALAANPAGLSYLSGRSLDLDLTAVFSRGSFSNSVNQNSPMTTSPGVIPYGAFGMPVGHSRFSFGVGFAPDMMSVSRWRYADAPGVGGASYGLQTEKSGILAGRSMAGFAVAINSRLSVGATIGVDYNSNTLEAPYTFQLNPSLAGLKTLLDLHTTGTGWNTSVGVLARPSKRVALSVAWKSRTVIDSTGNASGTLNQQFAALGIPFQPGYHYDAAVRNVLPQSILLGVIWHENPRWTFAFQTNWINWHDAFVTLPVALTNGTNSDVNGFLKTNSINDGVPLDWENQFSFHAGVERLLTESTSLRAGFSHENSPVPGSTVLPLTAAIMSNQISTGLAYRHGRGLYEITYGFDPTASIHVGQSSLLTGEYSNSTVRVGTQSVTINTSFRF